MQLSAANSSPPVIRMGHLMAFSSVLSKAGAPVDKMLSRAHLPVLCGDANHFVPLTRVWSFFDAAAASIDSELGWVVGKHVGDHNLNPALRQNLEDAPSLYQALYRLVEKVRSEASHLHLGICERKNYVGLFTHYPGMQDVPGYDQSQAYQLGVFLDLIRHFLGRDWSPEEVCIQAQHSPHGIKEQFGGSRILLGQAMGYIKVRRTSLHKGMDQEKSTSAGESPAPPNHTFDFDYTLRELLMAYLSEGYPSAAQAAELMDISERTLARRLSKRGLTYGELVDEVRFTLAKKLLQKPKAKISDVAIEVGFQDQSNFSRMFRRIGGTSPREFRKAMLH